MKKFVIALIAASSLACGVWGFNQYQTMQAKGEYLAYAVAHNKPFEKALLEWGKIQYLKTHATLPTAPVSATGVSWDGNYVAALKSYNEQFLK
jgi:hypothetical protein